jgi:uncharacterized protein (TIGR02646 family)
MIKVTKDYSSPPEVLTRTGCYSKIKKAVNSTNGHDSIYNGNHYKHEQVTTKLKTIYNKKCAYCESFSEHVATLQVEHYRPKAKVVDLTSPNPNGYYWLGCEWSNLLLACSKCNGKSAKANNFPISGTRRLNDTPFNSQNIFIRTNLLADSSFLTSEQPLLLNPEIDIPEQHLTFRHLGIIEGITLKGKYSVRIYTLNRGDLFKYRQEIVNKYVNQLKMILYKAKKWDYSSAGYKNTLKELFEEIEYTNIKTQEYILWRWYLFNSFADCILTRISVSYRRNIGKAFILYKQGNL